MGDREGLVRAAREVVYLLRKGRVSIDSVNTTYEYGYDRSGRYPVGEHPKTRFLGRCELDLFDREIIAKISAIPSLLEALCDELEGVSTTRKADDYEISVLYQLVRQLPEGKP